MESTDDEFRIAGIPVIFHPSSLVLLMLFVLLGGLYANREQGILLYLVCIHIFLLSSFGSLLAHELSHCLVLRSLEVTVESISFFAFGLAAKIKGKDLQSPKQEFFGALAGPMVSLLLAGFFNLLSLFAWPWIKETFSLLSHLNTLWAGYNLLPLFPLDGGRLLRSTLWYFKGRWPATNYSTLLTLGVVVLFTVWNMYRLVFLRDPSHLWLNFIGVLIGTYAFFARHDERPDT